MANTKLQAHRFTHLETRELSELANEMQNFRDYEPLLSTGGGKYSGHILGFVKGLRISAKLIYFLRKSLSTSSIEVSWGHIVDRSTNACSPECDVIIHKKGHFDKWNGNEKPVMDFAFIEAKNVLGVVSCKSKLTTIDDEYVTSIKALGIDKIILFAECCSQTNYKNLETQALSLGYTGLWCAYFTDGNDGEVIQDESHHYRFCSEMKRLFI